MRKLLLALLWSTFVIGIQAQTVLEELRQNPVLSSSNYMAYPEPSQKKLTPAPKGMKPFYISHYGRHGSRFHSRPSIYNAPYQTLLKADSLGKLTPLGHDVLLRLDRIRKDAEYHWGDLTPLGAHQQQDIAKRMMHRFPEVFKGAADVEARSTGVARCVLSMENTLMQMLRVNPHLNIHQDATHRDMYYLNYQDKPLFALKKNKASTDIIEKYNQYYVKTDHLMQSLFNDSAYVSSQVNRVDLGIQLLLVAAIMPGTELGKEVTLFDIFTTEEIYGIWRAGNIYWYVGYGPCPVNGGVQPYTQRNLLRRMITDADSCILQAKTNVQLRFGHETVLMPLVCLLDLNGYGTVVDDIMQLPDRGWVNYRVFPMASNLQFVFYRRHKNDRDVLFKVLLNESEATLPLPDTLAPYYKWSDFRDYYLKKLAAYEN